jgi:hypothetical protein
MISTQIGYEAHKAIAAVHSLPEVTTRALPVTWARLPTAGLHQLNRRLSSDSRRGSSTIRRADPRVRNQSKRIFHGGRSEDVCARRVQRVVKFERDKGLVFHDQNGASQAVGLVARTNLNYDHKHPRSSAARAVSGTSCGAAGCATQSRPHGRMMCSSSSFASS